MSNNSNNSQHTLVSSSDIITNNGVGPQLWGDGVTIEAFDVNGNSAELIYDTQFDDLGFGVKSQNDRWNQIDFFSAELSGGRDRSESVEIDFGGPVDNVVMTFGQMGSDERNRDETGKWTGYNSNGQVVAEGILDPSLSVLGDDVKVPGSLKAYPIAIDSATPFSKVVIEATGFDNGESSGFISRGKENNSEFNITEVSYNRDSNTNNNAPPTAVNDTFSTSEDTVLTGNVLSNDTDADGDSLSAGTLASPRHGSLSLAVDGGFSYTPNSNFSGSDSFTYQVVDNQGSSDRARVNITIDPVNDALTATNDVVSTNEDTTVVIDVTSNDLDTDGNLDPASAVAATEPSNGTVVNNGDGSFSYTPSPNFYGSDSFIYQVSDTQGSSDQATVSITVDPVNDTPTAVDDSINAELDTAVTFDVLANDGDIDGNSLILSSYSDPTNGSVVDDGSGRFTYTPNMGFIGTDTFSYTVSDGNGGTDSATASISVNEGTNSSERVTDGLQALYTFEEGTGDTVRDVSGVGTPLDLTIQDPGHVTWGDDKLTIDDPTLIVSDGPATKLVDSLTGMNQITIEAWLSADNLIEDNARIVNLSNSPSKRNFGLIQDQSSVDARLRTTDTNLNGGKLMVSPRDTLLADELTHVVYTRDASGLTNLYVDNELVTTQTISGDFSNWDNSYTFALGGELNDSRHWLGTLDLVAVYDQALNSSEVSQNFLAGPNDTALI
ncbi:MAG: tandem-95 repeat protein [Cyanobacteria bacterium J06592_8]